MEIQIFTESLIKKAKLSGRYSTADSYLSTLHRLQLFTNAPDMHFDKITPELIKAFEQHLFKKGCSTTQFLFTCACYDLFSTRLSLPE